ncbi:ubiquitin interaction motif-containing protein [Perilla frutescens var. hirtella]|uniref:ubiquitinyl hydrolase 1 n=1 Tax=Perilla frutescens var. hirtella TaxID=608512 RepID=A0AAD4JLJ8_PERFH|nr:ubiquitin interaction motif-containing protein [Perilla frutescens var. hirtella]
MVDQEDEDMKMAVRQDNQQHESPEPKRSKPRENSSAGGEALQPEESPEAAQRRTQRELMAAAAEKRMAAAKTTSATAVKSVGSGKDVKFEEKRLVEGKSVAVTAVTNVESARDAKVQGLEGNSRGIGGVSVEKIECASGIADTSLSVLEADELFLMIFGNRVTRDVLAQWTNQGIRFSDDPETSMGLVQHEGGPCGVLAAIQAFVLKYLLFSPEEAVNVAPYISSSLSMRRVPTNESVAADILLSLSGEKKSRALVRSMSEILFLCGRSERAVIVSLNILNSDFEKSANRSEDEVIAEVLGGLSVESGADLQKVLRVDTCTSWSITIKRLEAILPLFRSRMGALLFLISALLSRGLDNVQEDRDDPTPPLVTSPFGHASQEIVNLLLSGSAVPNVFDGKIDLGGGMFVKGISTPVEVGFLTLLESLNYCKVGQYLKCPKWPIWVVGSESHYTVLFALDTKVQEENELEYRESQIRRAFDAQDQSGGGGFIGVEGFHQVIRETNINLPTEKIEHLCSTGFIVWSEFWQVLLDLDKNLGGMKDSTGLMGKKVFDLYHFNGIAKSVANGSQAFGNESPIQRPRITKLKVSVPPRWTPEEFMADIPVASGSGTKESGSADSSSEVSKPAPSQHAPLVDCIRTRWPRSVCNWEGDAPSIV